MPIEIPAGQSRPVPTKPGKCTLTIRNPNEAEGYLILFLPSETGECTTKLKYLPDITEYKGLIFDGMNVCCYNDADSGTIDISIEISLETIISGMRIPNAD